MSVTEGTMWTIKIFFLPEQHKLDFGHLPKALCPAQERRDNEQQLREKESLGVEGRGTTPCWAVPGFIPTMAGAATLFVSGIETPSPDASTPQLAVE